MGYPNGRFHAILGLMPKLPKIHFLILLLCIILLAGCARARPDNVENVCSIFQQYPDWYWDAKATEKKWGVSVPVQMAIMYHESGFNARAQPPRKKILWIIPWKRPSSAYGYSQALKNTWKDYERQNGSGRRSAFDDCSDFIGWYSNQVYKKLGIRPDNAYALYLAYHEGPGGYASHSYLTQPWLIRLAHKVQYRADLYNRQLMQCQDRIPQKSSWW